jgi:aspartate-semialdehyde dehydrogenase
MTTKNRLAIVGITGIVGKELLKLLEKSHLEVSEILGFASSSSCGATFYFRNEKKHVEEVTTTKLKKSDIIFFCAGSSLSKKIIPQICNKETICIDLSSAFRLNKNVPLVIPEINADDITTHNGIIASPNCTSTIMLLPIYPLHLVYGIKSITATSYQSASGGGNKLINKLLSETKDYLNNTHTHSITPYAFNLYLHDSPIDELGYSEEETKMIEETKKILKDTNISVSPTCVRVPVLRAHSLSLVIEFNKSFDLTQTKKIINNAKGVKLFENYQKGHFPTPHEATNQTDIYCGRIRRNINNAKTLEMFVVGDQLLKGAALNAIQIAELLISLDNK